MPSAACTFDGTDEATLAALAALQTTIELVATLGYREELNRLLEIKLAIARKYHGIEPVPATFTGKS